jgi:hypothetical protein
MVLNADMNMIEGADSRVSGDEVSSLHGGSVWLLSLGTAHRTAKITTC